MARPAKRKSNPGTSTKNRKVMEDKLVKNPFLTASRKQQSRRVCQNSIIFGYDPRFVLRMVKHPPKLMIWAAFGNSRLGDIYFVAPNKKINAQMYRQVLRHHLKKSMEKTRCSHVT